MSKVSLVNILPLLLQSLQNQICGALFVVAISNLSDLIYTLVLGKNQGCSNEDRGPIESNTPRLLIKNPAPSLSLCYTEVRPQYFYVSQITRTFWFQIFRKES